LIKLESPSNGGENINRES